MIFRIYTVFYILLYLFITFSPEMLKLYGIWEWVDVAVMFLSLAGMASYTFIIKMFFRKFWEYFFYLFIIYELVYMTWLQLPLLKKLNLIDQISMSNLINSLMMLPVAFALFRLQQRWPALFRPAAENTPV